MDPAVEISFERLTWEQICERHPDEWVVLTEIDWLNRDLFKFRTAMLLGHSRIRKEAYQQTAESRKGRRTGCFFTGKLVVRPWELHY